MILIDLKLALFIALVGVFGGLGSLHYAVRRRTQVRRHPVTTAWHALELLPVGVVLLEADQTISFANRLALQFLGKRDSAEDSRPAELLDQLDLPIQSTTQRSGKISQPAPLRWWYYPLDPLDNQQRLLVLADDSEQQRTALQQQAFIGQLSHELRTPLTGLIAHTEILRNPQTTEAIRHSSVETIQRESQRIARLVRDLLELHRLETTNDLLLQPTNLVLVAEEAIASLILRAEGLGLHISFVADGRLPPVLTQPDRLKQVFVNLLDNALTYCRPGDTITVRLEGQPDGVVCVVEDNGPGIAATDLPHVTERLYRGRTDVAGNGMGLALASEILRQHQTVLTIESTTEGTVTGTRCSWMLQHR